MTSTDPFEGRIGRTFRESEPWWPARRTAPQDRPNVLVILFDDLGFAHLNCYGSSIQTPNINRLAANGLRFSNFHVAALCSPTRASLLTGRNHHTVGMRSIAATNFGYPNVRGAISQHAATMAEMLRDENYATFCVGKWHLTPAAECSSAGPYTDWPLQRGFDRFYGFLSGATDQFYPDLVYDNHQVDQPKTPEEGYHFTEDMVDRSTAFLREHESMFPQQPFFLYFTPGATHTPHHAPRDYIDRYRGKFDVGWDEIRREWYARQLELGIIPEGTELAPRNPGVLPWDDLSPNTQRFMATLQETFAGFLEHTDAQIGRLIAYLDQSGQIDNTIILLTADNGASQEGGAEGISVTARYGPPILDDVDEIQSRLDEIGGPRSSPNYPWGWAQAGNTPLKWYKQNTHGGGVRVPLIVHWPDGVADRGAIRNQFHHVSDMLPTVLETLGTSPPETYRGASQMPVSGTSFAYAFNEADTPTRKSVQYFEMLGHRGIWADGWKAVARHERNSPWSDEEWELYHVAEDFSETNNLAETEPERLRQLIDLWWVEAGRFGVLPLDDRGPQQGVLGMPAHRPGGLHEGLVYHYTPPIPHMLTEVSPLLELGPWTLDAQIERSDSADEGVIFAGGALTGGISFYLKDNTLHFDYNAFGDISVLDSAVEVPSGACTVGVRMDGDGPREDGHVTLLIDGEPVAEGDVPLAIRGYGGCGADIGCDGLSPVTDSYVAPFAFSGTIQSVDIVVTPWRSDGAIGELTRRRESEIMARQ